MLWAWRRRSHLSAVLVLIALLLLYNASTLTWTHPQSFPLLRNSTIITTCPDVTIRNVEEEPLARLDLRLGRWDSSLTFKTFDYGAVGDLYSKTSAARQVCLATQSSVPTVHEILDIAENWSGPISLAVFVIGEELSYLRGFAKWLSTCKPDVYSRLAVHIATPAYMPAVYGIMPDWARNCSAQPSFTSNGTYETNHWRTSHPYPQNMLRNLARKNCQSAYVYLVDVDIVPSIGMAEALDEFIASSRKCKLCAYVIPTYELDWSVPSFPSNKSELLKLAEQNLAVQFHKKVYSYNQLSSNLRKWEASRGMEDNKTHVSHDVDNYRLFYEPFYVAQDTVPLHDERFLGYGFTRNSQVYEMYLRGYQFKVLSPIFTIHWGLQSRKRPHWRVAQVSKNYQKFKTFKKELFARYGKEYQDPVHDRATKTRRTTT